LLKNIIKTKFALIIFISIILISIVNLSILYLFSSGPLKDTKTLIIEPGLSREQIANKLKSNDIIKFSKIFYYVSHIVAYKEPLKSGEYKFTPNISPLQVLKILFEGKSIIHKFKIIEGSMVYEIVQRIKEENLLFGEIRKNIPEGYLMPATYFYSYGDKKEQLTDQMLLGMSKSLDEVMPFLSPDSPLKTRLEVLTLASIVEKEASLDIERPLIAAVFLNRLKKGMKLQADPTSAYGVTEGKYKLDRAINKSDLNYPSLYNTYYVTGLPPGPICCPSLKSLKAVVQPANSSAIFFVVNGNGGHNFSNNLSDHNNFVNEYRKRQLKPTAPEADKPIIKNSTIQPINTKDQN